MYRKKKKDKQANSLKHHRLLMFLKVGWPISYTVQNSRCWLKKLSLPWKLHLLILSSFQSLLFTYLGCPLYYVIFFLILPWLQDHLWHWSITTFLFTLRITYSKIIFPIQNLISTEFLFHYKIAYIYNLQILVHKHHQKFIIHTLVPCKIVKDYHILVTLWLLEYCIIQFKIKETPY